MVMSVILLAGMLTIAPVTSRNSSIATPIVTPPEVNFIAQASLESEIPLRLDLTDRLFLANITNPQDARDFLEQMRLAATSIDPIALAELVHYPFVTYNNGRQIKTYATPAELLLDFEQIFTPKVITAMQNAQYNELFVNAQGAMISNGTVWFFQYSEGIKIKAINS